MMMVMMVMMLMVMMLMMMVMMMMMMMMMMMLHLHPLQDARPELLGGGQGGQGGFQVVALLLHLGQQGVELGLGHQ